jgi:hypothetical protein
LTITESGKDLLTLMQLPLAHELTEKVAIIRPTGLSQVAIDHLMAVPTATSRALFV